MQLSAVSDGEKEQFKKLLMAEFHQHPDAAIQDFYKFIHQSSMGPGHWKMDLAMAMQYLNEEIHSLRPVTSELLCQFLSSDSELVRINLRPYIALGGNVDSLAEAFVKSSNEFVQSQSVMEKNLTMFLQLVKERKIRFPIDSVNLFIQRMRMDHFPAVHHSPLYNGKYAPSYRVVYRKYLPVNIYHATRKN